MIWVEHKVQYTCIIQKSALGRMPWNHSADLESKTYRVLNYTIWTNFSQRMSQENLILFLLQNSSLIERAGFLTKKIFLR